MRKDITGQRFGRLAQNDTIRMINEPAHHAEREAA
jgi:hypothetical protein